MALVKAGATLLQAVKAAQLRAELEDAAFAELWRERSAWAKRCLRAQTLCASLEDEDATLGARLADLLADDKDPLEGLGPRHSEVEVAAVKDPLALEALAQIKRTCEHFEHALKRFYLATPRGERVDALRFDILNALERCEEVMSQPSFANVKALHETLARLEKSVSRARIGPWRALQEATALAVQLVREARIFATMAQMADAKSKLNVQRMQADADEAWMTKLGITKKRRRSSAASHVAQTNVASLAPEGLGVLRLVLYLHDRGCVARDLLRATESAQAQIEYAALKCATPELADLVKGVHSLELERRRRSLLARWTAAEALSGALIAASRLTHHVEKYFCALDQKHSYVRGTAQSLASRWPELAESVHEPLYHEIDRPSDMVITDDEKALSSGPNPALDKLSIADFVQMLLDDDDQARGVAASDIVSPCSIGSGQIDAATGLEYDFQVPISQDDKSLLDKKKRESASRPPWNPSVLVHDPIRTRGTADPIGKRVAVHVEEKGSG